MIWDPRFLRRDLLRQLCDDKCSKQRRKSVKLPKYYSAVSPALVLSISSLSLSPSRGFTTSIFERVRLSKVREHTRLRRAFEGALYITECVFLLFVTVRFFFPVHNVNFEISRPRANLVATSEEIWKRNFASFFLIDQLHCNALNHFSNNNWWWNIVTEKLHFGWIPKYSLFPIISLSLSLRSLQNYKINCNVWHIEELRESDIKGVSLRTRKRSDPSSKRVVNFDGARIKTLDKPLR